MNSKEFGHLQNLCKLIRYDIITSTTTAGAGHPSSSLSATELMATLFFGGFLRYDVKNPRNPANDHVLFSKGHASPLLYALYHAAGVISYDELLTMRKFDSVLEGHPTPRFPHVEVTTGSLGQGLSVGVGMAMGIQLKIKNSKFKIKSIPKTYVLLGDSEMAEGQVWEALEIASYYKLNNLIAILDVNRLGQRGATMLEWDIKTYEKRISSFGWKTITIADGHNIQDIEKAYKLALKIKDKPVMIIAKTIKGKGISFMENKDGWHGKPVPKDKLEEALKEIGKIDPEWKGTIQKPDVQIPHDTFQKNSPPQNQDIHFSQPTATREAYGNALVALGKTHPNLVVLDAETSNSTFAEYFKKSFPERFFEMFIAEQNMVSTALGLSKQGYAPFVSSFAAFFSRAFDQIRMAQYSKPNLKIIGSHVGVSIGSDGPSQMGLEDIAMMRSVLNSVVLYPSDAVSAYKLTEALYHHEGISYLRTTREKTPILYDAKEQFSIGGSKIVRQGKKDTIAIITAGITVHEALKACEELKKQNISVTVVDLYSIKPIDEKTLNELAKTIKHYIVVEDHYPYGGIGEAVKSVLSCSDVSIHHLAVTKIPRSGSPDELLKYEEIDKEAIISIVHKII